MKILFKSHQAHKSRWQENRSCQKEKLCTCNWDEQTRWDLVCLVCNSAYNK